MASDGEYADLFQSSGEEFRSDDDVYVDDEDDDEDDDDQSGELRVSSAIAADLTRSEKKRRSASSSRKKSSPGVYRDDPSDEENPHDRIDVDDDHDREAVLQNYINQKLNEEEPTTCIMVVRGLLILLLVGAVLAGVIYFSNAGVNHIFDAATQSDHDGDSAHHHSHDHDHMSLASVGHAPSDAGHDGAVRPKVATGSRPTKKDILLQKKRETQATDQESERRRDRAQFSDDDSDSKAVASALSSALGLESENRILKYTLQNSFVHNRSDFTEGLEFHPTNGHLYECTGLKQRSEVKSYALIAPVSKGPTLAQQKTRRVLEPEYFGEGCTIVGDKLYELTYKAKKGFVYDVESLQKLSEFSFESQTGEGWGVSHDSEHIIVSDGSSTLMFWDPENPGKTVKTLKVTGVVGGRPIWGINELEYVESCTAFPDRPVIFANIFPRSWIVAIDASTGVVVGTVDLSRVLKRGPGMDVLNGIAYEKSSGHFYLTGKKWPKFYVIDFE